MKTIFFSSLFLCINLLVSTAQTNNALSLQQCIEAAIKNNLEIKQSEFQMQAARVNSSQAKSNLLPVIFGDAWFGINQGRSIDPYTNSYINQQVNYSTYGVNGSLVLFNGLGLLNSIRRNELAYDASKMDLQQSKDNLTLRVIVAYLQVLSQNDLLEAANNQMAVTQKQVDRLEELNNHGAIIPSQLYDLKGLLANGKLTVVTTNNELDQAKLALAQLMNVPYDKNLQVQPLAAEEFSEVYAQTPDQIYATAIQQLGIVKAADLHLESAKKGVAVAWSNFSPTLSLNAGAFTNYSNAATQNIFQGSEDVASNDYVVVNGDQFPVITPQQNFLTEQIPYSDQLNNNVNTSISLGLSIPILNGLQAHHRVQMAKIERENAASVSETARIQLKQQIDQAYFNMTAAFDRYKTLLDQMAAFSESFRETDVRFNSGSVNSVDYLVAKNNMDRSNLNLIVARYDYVLRTKVLDYCQGILK